MSSDDQQCNICKEPFSDERPMSKSCGHIFGDRCLMRWTLEYQERTCPMCRHILVPNEDQPAEGDVAASDYARRTFTSTELRALDALWDDERHKL